MTDAERLTQAAQWAQQARGCDDPDPTDLVDHRVTTCQNPECGAVFLPNEDGFDSYECFECGEPTYTD